MYLREMVENREYLVANYTDPSFVKGMIVVIVMVVLAGILTIYSIYYVSMIPKVQEYGKLKAIGSTKDRFGRWYSVKECWLRRLPSL